MFHSTDLEFDSKERKHASAEDVKIVHQKSQAARDMSSEGLFVDNRHTCARVKLARNRAHDLHENGCTIIERDRHLHGAPNSALGRY